MESEREGKLEKGWEGRRAPLTLEPHSPPKQAISELICYSLWLVSVGHLNSGGKHEKLPSWKYETWLDR